MSAIRVGIAVLVGFSVLAHGAVEVWSQALLEIGAALLFLLWAVVAFRRRQVELRWNWLYLPMLGFGGFVLVQWLFGLSVYPHLTKIEFLKLSTYFLFFFLAVQSFRKHAEIRPFVWFLLLFGCAVAFFGILQFLSFDGKLYWFRELRFGGSPFGPYVNRNHFAGLMELIAPLGFAIVFFRAVQRDKLPLIALFTIIPAGALFLSASRGGILTFLLQLGLLGFLVWALQTGRKELTAATVIIVLAGAFVVWLGLGHALERFAQLWAEDLTQERRLVMAEDSWRIFLDHPWVGTGLGTLVTVYPQYATVDDGRLVDHVHNDYLEMLAETGLVGAVCCLAFVVLLFRAALANLEAARSSFAVAVRTGALVACSGLLVHSLGDFNFHIPSNALLFFLLAALATVGSNPQRLAKRDFAYPGSRQVHTTRPI